MGRLLRYEPCPRCRANGRDRRGDNLARYVDDSAHCFSCGYHVHPRSYVKKEVQVESKEGPLPRDFTRDVPAEGWKWLLSFGLPYSYWKPITGFSPATERLILTHGNPVEVSVGRFVGSNSGEQEPPRKWRMWGDRLRSATILEPANPDPAEGVVIVEDLISAHKVAQVAHCLPLFGTGIYPKAISALRALKRPVTLWLDRDQYTLLAPKINRLQTFLDAPVRFVSTDKDPKEYGTDEIRTILEVR